MKKPVSIILAILLVVAAAFTGVSTVQKFNADKKADQLQTDLTAAQTEIDKLTADNATANDALAAAQAEVDKLTADNAAAQDALAAAQAEVDKLTADYAAASDALAAAQVQQKELRLHPLCKEICRFCKQEG